MASGILNWVPDLFLPNPPLNAKAVNLRLKLKVKQFSEVWAIKLVTFSQHQPAYLKSTLTPVKRQFSQSH